MKKIFVASFILPLAACGHTNDQLAPWAHCQNLNLNFGTELYEQCIDDEKVYLSDEVQREEFKSLNKFWDDKSVSN